MRGWIRYSAVGAAAVVACTFSPRLSSDGGTAIDAKPAADAGACQTLGPSCASEDTLRTCTVVNMTPTDTACDWSCVGSDATAHCGVLVPSGGAATAADLGANPQLSAITLNTIGQIDGDDGTFGTVRSAADSASPYKNGVLWELRNGIAVFVVKNLEISANLSVRGSHAIVIVATDSITINAALDLHADCYANNSGQIGGPGGFTGADGKADATGSGGGKGGGDVATLGGAGGGHGAAGGSGGAVAGSTAVAGGPAFGDDAITLLIGGGAGGGGGNGGGVPKGGGGGGAIQLVANNAISITGGGSINAGGCGGTNGSTNDSGGGGGAGGTILLEAHGVTVQGQLAVNGGAGGPGGGGNDGSDALVTRLPAPGGTGGQVNAIGGDGAAGATLAGSAGKAGTAHAGGAGGAVGRMRFNSRNGQATVDNAKLSPALSDPGSTTTQGKPRVQ